MIEESDLAVGMGFVDCGKLAGSARSLLHDLGDDGLGDAETGFPQSSNRLVETDEPGLFAFIEHGERADNLQPSANRFLPSGLLINE